MSELKNLNGPLHINQAADSAGLKIYGYDDRSGYSGNIYLDSNGNLQINQTHGTGSGYIQIAAENYLSLSASSLVYTQSQFRIYDAGSLTLGNSGDYKIKYYDSNDTLVIHTNDNYGITLDNAGNATFTGTITGTTLTGTSLDINGNADISGAVVMGSTLDVAGHIQLTDGAQRNIIGALNQNLGIYANPNGADEGIKFSTDEGSTIEMIILNGGNVGIGTASPNAKLEILGSNNTTYMDVLHISNSNDSAKIKLGYDGNSHGRIDILDGSNNVDIRLSINTASYFNTGQNFGIGTASPGFRLEIAEDTNGTADLLQLRNSDSTYAQTWAFRSDTSKDLVITGSSGSGGIKFVPGSRGTTFTGDVTAGGKIEATHDTNYVAKFTNTATSMSNNTYTLMVDSSSHTSNMSAAGAFNVAVNSGNAFTIAGNGNATFGGNVTLPGIVLDGNTITGVDDSGEFTDDDAHIMTSAGANDRFTNADNLATGTVPAARVTDATYTQSTYVNTATDWDTLVTPGTYKVASGSGAQFTGTGRPITAGGVEPDYRYGHAHVTEATGQGIQQTFYPHSGVRVFFRTGWNNGNWQPWHIKFTTGTGIILDGNIITGIDDSGEFTDNDAHIMTSAAVQDKILSYGYGSGSGSGDVTLAGTQSFTGAKTFGAATQFNNTVTVGADTSGHDVKFFGNATGEYMLWDESSSKLNIRHDTDDSGLTIFTVSSASMTQPQIQIGRDSGQYWGVYTDDRNAHMVHRQDETTGTMTTRFDQWDSNTSDNNGSWLWRFGNGTGGSMATALTLTQAGVLTATTFSGNLNGTINTATTATTQSASDNSTKVATTAYVDAQVATVVDSAPGTLNTLNELAAALGDDASFSTTVTNSIAAKLPLAGGNMTGAIAMGNQNITGVNEIEFDDGFKLFGGGSNNYLKAKAANTTNGGIIFQDGDSETMGYIYWDGASTANFGFLDATGTWAVRCRENEWVRLHYDNSIKLQTKSDGVDITGELQCDTLDVDGNADISGNLSGVDTLTCTDLTIGSDATTAIGKAYLKTPNVSTVSYQRINADETLSLLNAAQMLSAIGGVAPNQNTSGSSGSCTGNAATATKISSITNSNIVQLSTTTTQTGTKTFSGVIDITNTTASSNATGDTGALRCEGGASIAGKIYAGSTITGSADVIAFSYRNLKENIETLDGKKVLDMRGVSFTRKDTGAESSGVIAQEIQDVAPELVRDTEGTLGVAYGNLVGYLIEAIKDQQKQIDELKEICNGCSK
jgi:hypothetical protein